MIRIQQTVARNEKVVCGWEEGVPNKLESITNVPVLRLQSKILRRFVPCCSAECAHLYSYAFKNMDKLSFHNLECLLVLRNVGRWLSGEVATPPPCRAPRCSYTPVAAPSAVLSV